MDTRYISQSVDHTERRGTITYTTADGINITTFHAWFMLSLDGRTVVARKIGGRNRWQFCSADAVLDFKVEYRFADHSKWSQS